jgi:CRISPR-associated endoribonuclease Cas6
MSEVARRLTTPSRRLALEALAREWFGARIAARIPGYGALAHDLDLLRRLRGGLGEVLLEGASAEAIAGRPCPWDPPCTLDILFREQGRAGAHGIPKPYVLAAERRGRDLVVVLTLFGFAANWSAAATHALLATVQHRIDWRGQRPDLFLPRHSVDMVTVRAVEGLPLPDLPPAVDLVFLTPVNAEGDDPFERPSTLLARLARRVEGLARWQDAAIAADWPALASAWREASYDLGQLRRAAIVRRSGRERRDFTIGAAEGVLRITELPAELWPLLVIGSETHIGKGASEGFGRYLLA